MIVHLKSTLEKINALNHNIKFLLNNISKHKHMRDLKTFQYTLNEMSDIINSMIEDMRIKKEVKKKVT